LSDKYAPGDNPAHSGATLAKIASDAGSGGVSVRHGRHFIAIAWIHVFYKRIAEASTTEAPWQTAQAETAQRAAQSLLL
jgi:hypothetical protein